MNAKPTPNDISAVIPEHATLTIAGEDVAIRQIKIGQLPVVLRAVQPIAHMLKSTGPLDIANLFMLYADDCLTLLAALAGKPRAWVDTLDIDDAITLFTALLEVNLDFFVRRVLPLLPGVLAQLRNKTAQLTAMAGPTASTPSSPTAIA